MLAQGIYYVTTGAVPLISRRLFESITGKKTDWWLVQLVGMLAMSIGATLFVALREEKVSPETRTLAISSALSFALVDVVYVAKRRISPVYLVDAAIELPLAAGVLLSS